MTFRFTVVKNHLGGVSYLKMLQVYVKSSLHGGYVEKELMGCP